MTTTAVETKIWIAEIDMIGSEMERPFIRAYVQGTTEDDATAEAVRHLDKEEAVRRVVLLQPILDGIAERIASGTRYAISWKHEGREGPVVITDLDAMEAAYPPDENGARLIGIPFGSELACETVLPWTSRAEAGRLAKYLGLKLGVS